MHQLEIQERAGWDALTGPNGAAFYEDQMADDGLMVFPDMVLDKTAALKAIREAGAWSGYDLDDVRVIEIGDRAGIVIYRALAHREGRVPYAAVMCSVYARRGGPWRLILHQQSPAP